MSLLKCLVLHRETMAIAASVVVQALHFPGNSVLPMFILLFTEEGHLADYTPFCYPTVFRDALFNLSLLLSKVLSAVRRNNFSTSSVYVFCIEFYFILE